MEEVDKINEIEKEIITKSKKKRERKIQEPLEICYNSKNNDWEIGIDEAGRGPLFGRVYSAAVVLPKDKELFNHSLMKDSKKFTSKKKLEEAAEYVKSRAISYCVSYEDENTIDKINILQATFKSMHTSVKTILHNKPENIIIDKILVDGNNFKPFTYFQNGHFSQLNHLCIEGGDNKYTSIAAASILAKVERDKYIEALCEENPELDEKYGLVKNKGYGTKKHIDGIKEHGITKYHRKTYGLCRNF
jgi:ribonuclease HII